MGSGIYFGTAFGLFLSIYAIYIEHQITQNEDFVALCDINQEISCSKALSSDYKYIFSALNLISSDSLFNRLNCEYGILFYIFIFVAYQLSKKYPIFKTFLLLSTSFGMVLSVVLAYVMITILKTLCLICIATYLTNLLLLLIAINENFFSSSLSQKLHSH
jgi:vitamin-K-epoxide reductase (warfarin-sensitive)